MPHASHEVTQLLIDWSNGDQAALDKLLPLVYDELRQIAKRYVSRQSPGHTLQTTALINEAFLKLVGQQEKHWQNRAHFFGVAAGRCATSWWITRAPNSTPNEGRARARCRSTKR